MLLEQGVGRVGKAFQTGLDLPLMPINFLFKLEVAGVQRFKARLSMLKQCLKTYKLVPNREALKVTV